MFAVVAVVAGLVAGLVTGGKLRNLGEHRFRAAWLLVAGVLLQVLVEFVHFPKTPDYAIVIASYSALALFALCNVRVTGMAVVAIGLALNIVPIALNRGMPVRASAIVDARIARPDQFDKLGFGAKRHLERPADRATFLADILPDRMFHEVLSFGDLIMAAGIAAVLFNLLRPAPRRLSTAVARYSG